VPTTGNKTSLQWVRYNYTSPQKGYLVQSPYDIQDNTVSQSETQDHLGLDSGAKYSFCGNNLMLYHIT